MATISDLNHILAAWLHWLRLRRASAWAWRGLTLGLGLAFVLDIAGLLGARLLRAEFLALTGMLALAIPLVCGAMAYLWPIQPLEAARSFDRDFHLQERVSTALELARQPADDIHGLRQQQLEDTLSAARKVKPSRALPLRLRTREGLLALLFGLSIGLVWWRGEAWFQAAQQNRAVEQAVIEQAASIEELIQKIEADKTLSMEQKEALTAPLEETLKELQANPSLEGSVSVLTSSGEKLQALSDPQAAQMTQALQQAGEQLAQQADSPLQDFGQNLSEGDIVAAASALQNLDLENLSQAEISQLAGQLESAANAIASTDPQLADKLSQAAQALREGDMAAAQQALDQAAGDLARAGQKIAYSQMAQQAAGQLQQGAGQVIAAGGGQQGQTPANASTLGGGTNPDGQSPASSGAGAGEGEGQGSQAGSEATSASIPQDNGPGDGGEHPYEQIYAPSLLGGEGGPQVGLPGTGDEGDLVGTTTTNPSEPGESLVPYSEVYPQYEQINNQAIESGDIPSQFIQIIQNYFNALEP